MFMNSTFVDLHTKPALDKGGVVSRFFEVDANFQTPIPVCEYMVSMVPDNAFKILEPTPGLGNIVKALESKGKYVIYHPEDFFLLDKSKRFDCIVMNPPFSSKSAFIDKDAREHFQIKTHKRLIDIMSPTDNTIESLIHLDLPAGVDVEIKM